MSRDILNCPACDERGVIEEYMGERPLAACGNPSCMVHQYWALRNEDVERDTVEL
jgi:hypothetical protein